MPVKVSLATVVQEIQDIPVLLAAGGHDRKDVGHEMAAGCAVGAVAGLAPLHGMAQRSFGGIVGRFNSSPSGKSPQRWLQAQNLPAHRRRLGAGADAALGQKVADPGAHLGDLAVKTRLFQGSIANAIPHGDTPDGATDRH